MKSEKMKFIIILLIGLAIVGSIVFTVVKKNKKHKDVLKDTTVNVNVDLTSESINEELQEQGLKEMQERSKDDTTNEEEFYTFNDFDSSDIPIAKPESGESSEDKQQGDIDDTTEEETVSGTRTVEFSYTSINNGNYVNFMEQLCKLDFSDESLDISNIPLSAGLLEILYSQSCVDKDALTYDFMITDNGYNDDTDRFYVILHIPNESKDYVLVEGFVEGNKLAAISVTKMR